MAWVEIKDSRELYGAPFYFKAEYSTSGLHQLLCITSSLRATAPLIFKGYLTIRLTTPNGFLYKKLFTFLEWARYRKELTCAEN